jgi:hypothetical protein
VGNDERLASTVERLRADWPNKSKANVSSNRSQGSGRYLEMRRVMAEAESSRDPLESHLLSFSTSLAIVILWSGAPD